MTLRETQGSLSYRQIDYSDYRHQISETEDIVRVISSKGVWVEVVVAVPPEGWGWYPWFLTTRTVGRESLPGENTQKVPEKGFGLPFFGRLKKP